MEPHGQAVSCSALDRYCQLPWYFTRGKTTGSKRTDTGRS